MASRKGPRKVNKRISKERHAKNPPTVQPVQQASRSATLQHFFQDLIWFTLRTVLAFYGDTIKPAAWSLCWTVMALTVNIAQAVGVGALLLRMLPFWIPRVAADGLTFSLLSSTGCFLWLLMTKVLIPWAHGCWLAFFHKAAQPQAPSPPCCANDNDLHLEAQPNRHQRKAARRAARLTAATETPTSSHVNGAGGGSDIKGSHGGKEDNHAADMVAQSAAPVDDKLNKRQRKAAKRAAAKVAVAAETKTATDSKLQTSETKQVPMDSQPNPMNNRIPRSMRLPSTHSTALHSEENASSSTKQGAKKGGGTTSTISGRTTKSPEHPTTPPQGPPATRSSTTQGVMNYQAARAPRKSGALHPKNSTKTVTGAPSSARPNTRSQLGASRVNTGSSSPLVGNRVDFATKITYFIEQGYPVMAKKLQALPHLSQRRSICGDGNCAYRALLMGLLEAAVAADDYTRQSLVQQVKKLRRELPVWASSSFDASSNVAYGYDVLMELISHPHLTAEDMADVCCRQRDSNSMVLFLRAVAAASMATNKDMNMWAIPIREALPGSYRTWSLMQMVRNCVLPLAGSPNHELWKWRHGGHAELGVLAAAFGVHIKLHDVETEEFWVSLGPDVSRLNMSLLSTGGHIELVF